MQRVPYLETKYGIAPKYKQKNTYLHVQDVILMTCRHEAAITQVTGCPDPAGPT